MGRGIRFTTEFKREAVRLALSSGRPRAEIAEDLGVGLSSLTRWIGQFRDEEMPPEIKDDPQPSRERGGQIHRRVLQSDPAALDARLPEPGPVRDGRPGVSKQLSTNPKQDQDRPITVAHSSTRPNPSPQGGYVTDSSGQWGF